MAAPVGHTRPYANAPRAARGSSRARLQLQLRSGTGHWSLSLYLLRARQRGRRGLLLLASPLHRLLYGRVRVDLDFWVERGALALPSAITLAVSHLYFLTCRCRKYWIFFSTSTSSNLYEPAKTILGSIISIWYS